MSFLLAITGFIGLALLYFDLLPVAALLVGFSLGCVFASYRLFENIMGKPMTPDDEQEMFKRIFFKKRAR